MTVCGLLHGPFAYVCAFLCVRVWLVIVYASVSRTLEGLLQRPLIGGVWMGENVVTDEQSLSAEGLRERNVDAQGWRQEVIISQCGNKLRGTTKLR